MCLYSVCECVCVLQSRNFAQLFAFFFFFCFFLFFFFFLWLLGSPLHLSLGRTSSRLKQPSRHTHTQTQKHSASAHGHNSHLVTSSNLWTFFRPSRWPLTSVVHRNNNESFSEEMFCLFVFKYLCFCSHASVLILTTTCWAPPKCL